jgi:hypothetical protein
LLAGGVTAALSRRRPSTRRVLGAAIIGCLATLLAWALLAIPSNTQTGVPLWSCLGIAVLLPVYLVAWLDDWCRRRDEAERSPRP